MNLFKNISNNNFAVTHMHIFALSLTSPIDFHPHQFTFNLTISTLNLRFFPA